MENKDRTGATIFKCPDCGIELIEMGQTCSTCKLLNGDKKKGESDEDS